MDKARNWIKQGQYSQALEIAQFVLLSGSGSLSWTIDAALDIQAADGMTDREKVEDLNGLTSSHSMLLRETYPNHPDRAPEQTAFLKELFVPGSTK